jgi:hypothetical protein
VVKAERGLTVVDLLVVLALVALLVWLVRLDHRRSSDAVAPVRTAAHLAD